MRKKVPCALREVPFCAISALLRGAEMAVFCEHVAPTKNRLSGLCYLESDSNSLKEVGFRNSQLTKKNDAVNS
jgi:hypothetical protein